MFQNPHIFYTDDDEDDQELFRGALSEVDETLVLTTVNDGDALLQLLKSPPPVPRIIFLDLNMPRRNGFEVLQQMRGNEELKDYPVIIFSTTTDSAAIRRTQEMGANCFVTKPRTYDALRKAIEACIRIDWQQHVPDSENYLLRFN